MTVRLSAQQAIDELARDPLPHIVLLKQLLAYPDHVKVHRVSGSQGTAMLVALDTSVSAYDRQAYPKASIAAFIASDHPALTAALMDHVPQGVGIVFKLSAEADLAAVAARFSVVRRTAFISFTATGSAKADGSVRVTSAPGDAAFALFETQGHDRAWLEPMLAAERAIAYLLERDGDIQSACFAFENYGPVWEVGGVVTTPAHRRQGLGSRLVATALAELARRGLSPRYQVEEDNKPSIRLALSVGLSPFLTIVHYGHGC
jgi:GNAT superfamily N-acetyltransferase